MTVRAHLLHAASLLAAALAWLSPGVGLGFDIEEEHVFPAVGGGSRSSELHILSTTDLDYFEPFVQAFQQSRPDVSIRYTVASSRAVFEAVSADAGVADVVVSSAMDLQIKLVNDGYAAQHDSAVVQSLPDWARWRSELFAYSLEPVSLVVSAAAFEGLDVPTDRQALFELLSAHPERFHGRIGTYDITRSGAGYLFATQDARRSETWSRLMQRFGELDVKLYCCSADMLDDVQAGRLALAYNVVGAYARASLGSDSAAFIAPLDDFTLVLQRTVFIPRLSRRRALAGVFVDYLLSDKARALQAEIAGAAPIDARTIAATPRLRPVGLGPGLLVYLDRMKRERFTRSWQAAVQR